MKKLYAAVVRGQAAHDLGDPTPSTGAEVDAAEARLGHAVSRSYRAFVVAVGAASWPVEIYGPAGLVLGESFGPAWFLPFATDGGGNDWGWDLRARPKRGEYPILFWDHEEPPDDDEVAEPGTAESFDAWLAERVEHAADEDDEEAWADLARDLAQGGESRAAYVPALDDVRAVEERLGKKLPADYVRFTTTLGSTRWPFEIVDGQDCEALTRSARAEHAKLGDAIAFGRDRDGTILAFRGSAVVSPMGTLAKGFLGFLRARIEAERAPAPPAAEPAYRFVEVPAELVDKRARDLFYACAEAEAFHAEALGDGRVELRIEVAGGGRRRSFVDQATWELVAKHLRG